MYGLPQDQIEALEAPLSEITFSSIVERLDSVIGKAWSYQWEGPEIVDVPTKVAKYPNAKNPRVFVTKDVPHYKCCCTIMLGMMSDSIPMIREYTLLMAVTEGAFEVIRDLSFIYAAHYGCGVGKRSAEIFPKQKFEVKMQLGPEGTQLDQLKEELDQIKAKMGIKKNIDLDEYVKEWSGGELGSHMHINKTNLLSFTEFLKTKTEDHGKSNPGR
jgi:hypothetical protein